MPSSIPTVLIPGLLCSARLYSEQLPALWGFGPVMIADHTRDEEIVPLAKGILAHAPPRFALAGLSMGGYIALEIIRQAPERVVKLALLDTSARSDTPEQSAVRKTLIELARNNQLDHIVMQLLPKLVHPCRQKDNALLCVVDAMAREIGPAVFIRQQKAIMSRPDSRPWLRKIECPTMVIVGDGDELTPPALSEEIAQEIPTSHLFVVPNCGHLSALEQPEVITSLLVDWLITE